LLITCAYILALPFLIIWGLVRLDRYVRVLVLSVSPSIRCISCHSEVVLLGIWRCQCGFTYQGHLMRPCPVCNRVPRVVRCLRCSVTTKLM
jgi:hypothetical protein